MYTLHPIEADGINSAFFYLLAKENKKDLRSCRVNIPATVLFEQGFAKAVFATEPSKDDGKVQVGEVKRKAGKDVDPEDLFDMLARGAHDDDIAAVMMFASPRTTELKHVRFLNKVELRRFIFQEIEKPRCLLQRFIKPKGNNNTVIHAVWSPLLVITEGRRNVHSLSDRHLTCARRATTFEDSSSPTVEVVVAQAVIKKIAETCATVAEHCEKTDRITVTRLACFFKVDENSMLQLLSSTSVRVQDAASASNAPVSMGLHVRSATKDLAESQVNQATIALKEREELDDAEARTRRMHISIPCIGDVGSMIVKSLHDIDRKRSPPRQQSPPRKFPKISSPEPRLQFQSTLNRSLPPAMKGSQLDRAASPTAGASPTFSRSPKEALKKAQRPAASPKQFESSASPDHYTLPPPRSETKVVYVRSSAPTPQPAQLMRYQHILPNSAVNLAAARQQEVFAESEIRSEWDEFLREQARGIAVLRIQSEKQKDASRAEAQNASIAAALERRDQIVPPDVRHHTTFAEQSPHERRDSIIVEHVEKEEEKAPEVTDKDIFMADVRRTMAERAAATESQKAQSPKRGSNPIILSSDEFPEPTAPQLAPVNVRRGVSMLHPPVLGRHAAVSGQTPARSKSPTTYSPKHDRSQVSSPQSKSAVVFNQSPPIATNPKNRVKVRTPEQQKTVSPTRSPRAAYSRNAAALGDAFSSSKKLGKRQNNLRSPTTAEPPDAANLLLRKRAKVLHGFSATTEMSPDQLQELNRRAAEECRQFEQYVCELIYATYCYILEHRRDAYVEIPERFVPFVSCGALQGILHKLHGTVENRFEYLSAHCPWNLQGDICAFRDLLIDQLHVAALRRWMPEQIADPAELLRTNSSEARSIHRPNQNADQCFIIPHMEESFTILKGEGSRVDLQPYFEEDGLIFDGARRYLCFSMLIEIEGEREALAKMQHAEEEERQSKAALQTFAPQKDDDSPSISLLHAAAVGSAAPVPKSPRKVTEKPPPAENDMFCQRCNSCRICCVCSLIFSPGKSKLPQIVASPKKGPS